MRWRTKVRLSATLALIGATFLANIGDGALAEDAGAVVSVRAVDAAMGDARALAQHFLDPFLDHVLLPDGATIDGAAVKVAVKNDNGVTEVIWMTPFAKISEDGFLGILANPPRNMSGLSLGDAIAFERAQVRDWSFVGDDTKVYGNFTARVLLPHIPENQAAQIASALSDAPIPPDWR